MFFDDISKQIKYLMDYVSKNLRINGTQPAKVNKDLESSSLSKAKSPNKKNKAKISDISTSIKNPHKKKIIWSKSFVQIVEIESYKKYNLANTHDEPSILKEKIRCNCVIF
jgi:hypothetical protein